MLAYYKHWLNKTYIHDNKCSDFNTKIKIFVYLLLQFTINCRYLLIDMTNLIYDDFSWCKIVAQINLNLSLKVCNLSRTDGDIITAYEKQQSINIKNITKAQLWTLKY